jgi:predicted RND superfamily exporter protein
VWPNESSVISRLENLLFGHRRVIIALFALVSAVMVYFALQLRVDAGFTKLLPLQHEYMQTFLAYRDEFGGADRILVALEARRGDIFTPEFFEALKEATDEVFFIPGVDRSSVHSLFTPNTRFTEVVEDGITGGSVVPDDFQATPAGLAKVRENVLKAGIVGRLVANDFTGALISAQLMEVDPATGERLDYVAVARELETQIRGRFQGVDILVHIIGFAKVIGDITEGARRVLVFFTVAFVITAALVYWYSQSLKLTLIPLACSLVAVIWQLGMLPMLGFGIDPMSILVPFLVFAIGVSHGVQMVSVVGAEAFKGADALAASRRAFRRLLIPGGVALISDAVGFVTILLIDIRIIQEMALTASIGVAVILLTNLVLLPVLMSYLHMDQAYRERLHRRARRMEPLWQSLYRLAEPRPAAVMVAIAAGLVAVGLWKGTEVKIGDLHRGVPELRVESRYNTDSRHISERYAIGVDVLTVIVETVPEGCIDYAVMSSIDEFQWLMQNVSGVRSVIALPRIAKVINAGWNEGNLKWRVLPRNQDTLAQSVSYVPTSSGLLNSDCSVMPVLIFTTDHKAETISHIVDMVKAYGTRYNPEQLRFRLATGNVGVMAATNEEVRAAQFPILAYVFCAIILLCLVSFRSIAATLCIVIPLGLVSLLAYALMAWLEIGLKVNTLPVVALGVGIGVDYGIYIYSRMSLEVTRGWGIPQAYRNTLTTSGNGVIFTGVTLATGVATWIFSPLKFQADMGILLTFMFVLNMLGAIILLPALASWLLRRRYLRR